MRRLDLRGRVTLASAAVLAAGLAVITVGVSMLLSDQLSSDASDVLRERADVQLATLGQRDGRLVVRELPGREALDERAWVFVDGREVRRPAATPAAHRAARGLANAPRAVERDVGERLRLRAEPAFGRSGHARIATIVVGVSLAPYEDTERIALLALLAVDLFVLAAGALLARRAVGNALRPVADMTSRAADWSEHDLDRRFGLGPPRDELTALSGTLDALLGRIAASLRHEQRFSAEMAHELRTPLSHVRGEAELALRAADGGGTARPALEAILRGTDRMAAVIETLMVAARGEARGPGGEADALAVARTALEAVAPAAQARGVGVRVVPGAGPVRVGVDAELAAQALHPLLDNAVRHARSAVRVSAHADGDVVICVRDDGPGVAAAEADAIFEPGRSGADGPGLGLALARRLARSCGGDVRVVPGADGGRFDLRLPGVGPGVQAPFR
jgi:signal transduction histidine kinase